MAHVTYGGGVTEYKGSIGGVTYQRNASGFIAKLRSRPTLNPSPDQNTYQVNLAQLVSYWPTLSQANKDSWDAFAVANDHTTVWGETKTLNGFQWFLSCNLNRLLLGSGISSNAPVWFSVPVPDAFTIETAAGYIRAAWVPAYNPADILLFYMSLPLRQSSLKLRRSLFFVWARPPDVAMDNFDLTTYFEALANVTWATFFASADASIIIRIRQLHLAKGLSSSYTSAIIKIS